MRTQQVVVHADPRSLAADVVEAIGQATGEPESAYYVDRTRISGREPIRQAGLHDGAVLHTRPVAEPAEPPPALLQICVVSGPGAGLIVPLSVGTYGLGSGEDCAIRIAGASELAVTVTAGPDGTVSVTVHEDARLIRPRPPDSRDPQTSDTQAWPADADLAVHDSLLRWSAPVVPDAAVRPSADGAGLDFNRPPRIVEPLPRERFRLPAPPERPGRRPFPVVMMLAPALMGILFVLVLHSVYFLIFMVLTPVFAVSNWVSDRRGGRRDFRRKSAEYVATRRRMAREIGEAVVRERRVRSAVAPDPATVLRTATGPGRRLWERRRRDPDHLVLRLGTVDQPSVVDVEDAARRDPLRPGAEAEGRWTVPAIPVAVSLTDVGVLGIAGPGDRVRTLASWLLTQAATLHSPRDVRLVLLTEPDREPDWGWLRWLPHARAPQGDAVLVGNDPETVAFRVAEVLSIVKRRTQARGAALGAAMFIDADIVLVADGARLLRDVPGFVDVLADGPAVRVFAVCLDSEERLLPEEARAVVLVEPDGTVLRQPDQPDVRDIRPDLPEVGWFEQTARALAPLRDTTPEDGGSLPSQVRLLDLLDLPEPDAAEVAARWALQPGSTTAIIGTGYDGPAAIDLVRDGPHTLIAGTTGSGKSELLQTLVASLAAVNRPDELTFLLIDYKGGSAFRDCVHLPHTLGMVTDLDGHLVDRALESLAAELRRRERLLAEHGAKDHPDYQAARRRDPGLPPLPRLVLVVDEFATLVREVPAFITGVVSLAQRGRSLGIHLVLATQRPAGAVTGDIRANTNLRIALRVTDPGESQDVIDTVDAAAIPPTLPGRALVRLAHRAVVPFQAGYTGGEYDSADAEAPIAAPWARTVPWSRLGRRLEPPLVASAGEESARTTDLAVLVRTLRQAAEDMGVAEQPSPWLPALPTRLSLAELPAAPVASAASATSRPDEHRPGSLAPVVFALEDIPALQLQRPVTLDLDTFAHLYVIGAARSGRSQTLRTLAAALADRHSTADVHFYGIDAGGGALAVLGELPHTGAIVQRADLERVDRLLTRLGRELTRRQDLLAEHHAANLVELRGTMPPGPRPAHALLLLDGWEAFYAAVNEYDGGRLVDEVVRLLREGAAAGLHVVMAGDRALLSGRMGTLNEHRLLLRMTDRSDYLLVGLTMDKLPTAVPPGRAWSSGGTELQIAVVAADPSGAAQAEAIRALGAQTAARDTDVGAASRPLAIGVLPAELGFNEAFERVTEHRPLLGLIGLDGDGQPVTADFAGKASSFLICGPPGTGRSTALATLAVSLLAGGTNVVALTPRASPLRRIAAHPRARVLTDPNPDAASVDAALEELGAPCVVLVDDADLLVQMPAAEAALRRIVATGRDRGLGLAAAATPETLVAAVVGWLGEARRIRQGLLLNPQSPSESDLLGARLSPNQVRRPPRPGRGYVADAGGAAVMQIALPLTVLKDEG